MMCTSVNPSFNIKVGFKVVKILKICFRDGLQVCTVTPSGIHSAVTELLNNYEMHRISPKYSERLPWAINLDACQTNRNAAYEQRLHC